MSALPWRCRELSSRWAASVAARSEHCYSTAVERVNPGEGAGPSQAARLGVRVGWVIVAVDGVDAAGIGHDELLARVQKLSLSTAPLDSTLTCSISQHHHTAPGRQSRKSTV